MKTTKKVLVILAGAVWYSGGIMLLRGGLELVHQARELRPASLSPWVFILPGIILGIIQALTIFSRSCRKNLDRIKALEDPRLWQFFRPGFFLALALMITSGVLLDRYSQGSYPFMMTVAALDFALTISLLGSSYIFWIEKLPDEPFV